MQYQATTSVEYAVYVCGPCRDNPADECGDSCTYEWTDELPPFGDDYWPVCKCCGKPAMLVAPLLRV